MLGSVPNFRDVADGIPGVRPGVLFRSDLVTGPDPQDAARIAACNIGWVADLRGAAEREARPNAWLADAGAEIAGFDVAGRGNPEALARAVASGDGRAGAHALMVEVYRQFPEGAMPVIDAISRRIAETGDVVLIHCAAGKDRTGFVVAAILTAAGVGLPAVEADFLTSHGRVHQRTRDYTREAMRAVLGEDLDEEALDVISGVHRDFLHGAIAAASEMHGSFADYLAASGIDEARANAVRARLIA